ncbi:MAG: hypothetical protein C5S47_05850 [Candidatus Methanogasteraceae archaeon]|nr:MAG: hypothetical protein C5S47_05850 [ANME-2 cluster archaeon]
MNTVVLDSDALIKLTKASCLGKILGAIDCFISGAVYEETVINGMKRFHEDAFRIDELVKEGKLKIEETRNNEVAQDILKGSALGKGEKSALHLFFNKNALAIVSDDNAFLNILRQNNIPFIIPTDLIVRLYELKIITMEEFMKALDMIKPYVSKHNYDRAKNSPEV